MLLALMLNRPRKFFSREKVKKRPSDMLKFTMPGPVMVFRPAVPSWPEAGSVNAAVLKKSSVVLSERGRLTGRPVASGRSEAEHARTVVIRLVSSHLRGQRRTGLYRGNAARFASRR